MSIADSSPSLDTAEYLAATLYRNLTPAQRSEICFAWDHHDPNKGLLRTFIANHWQITRPCIRSDFFTSAQQQLIHDIFQSLLSPEWYPHFMRQLHDDSNGHEWGTNQSIGLFGTPDEANFQLVISGRHLLLRTGGKADGHVAFGGPILYGHQATGYYERPNHPGNVFWPQALSVSQLAATLDNDQINLAVVPILPGEEDINFRAKRSGLAVTALSATQKRQLETTMALLIQPFRASDQACVLRCLAEQGGLDSCHLMLARDGRMSPPHWDNWRIEGPSFVWHFRGFPHVHVWVQVADDAAISANAHKGVFLFPEHDPLL
jgi:hypothetical protein